MEVYTGEPRASEFLNQSIIMAIQKGNAMAILGTVGESGIENTLEGELSELS